MALDRLRKWSGHELVHVKRAWIGSGDSLASAAMQRQGGIEVQGGPEYQDQASLNWLDEILMLKTKNSVVRIAAVTTRASRVRSPVGVIGPDPGDAGRSDQAGSGGESKDHSPAVPDTLLSDILHHYHTTLEGGHQGIPTSGSGITSTGEDCIGVFSDIWGNAWTAKRETGKEKPAIRGESPGNLQATHPFQIIAMDHIPSLPRSHKGNTELLIWVDLFTGYVIAKASSSLSVQMVAESFEECVFRRFGASEMNRHDREPGFMSISFCRLTRSWNNGRERRWHIDHKLTGQREERYRRRPGHSRCTFPSWIERIGMSMLSGLPSQSIRPTIGS
ncbi:LOW QUALITY PROTEIN: reverse transcriptase [Phytophthora megakarya]|uniref:Reverse transcriptase n=1 Tax=Phytophthora megakarya TaxID=4795 RepID=A0A225WJR5_9STRA|nr:LOW QUALITY PROTEIN: reverse transcriptase [Phytophthora megakarya]